MGDHSYPPGTVFGPDGQPFGPLTASPPDVGIPASQDSNFEEVEPAGAAALAATHLRTAAAPTAGASAATRTQILNVARSQLGFVEGPNNDNPYGKWYGWNHVPYCAIGITWAFAMANGLPQIDGKPGQRWSYCPYFISYWKGAGRWHEHTEAARPGDIVFYDWTGAHRDAEHVGILESIDYVAPNNVPVLVTLEWNTTSGIPGNQSDGGGMYRRRRSLLYVVGYGRPSYAPETQPVPIPSRGNNGRKLMPLLVDGIWGSATTKHLQVLLHVSPTGTFSPTLRRRLQAMVGVTQDGVWGPQTHKALQRFLHVPADGDWGPITIKALQRMLNRTV